MENNNSSSNNHYKWRKVTDFALSTSSESEEEVGDLLFDDSKGDFALEEDATRQHQGHNLVAAKGDLRAFPQGGVHLAEFLNSEGLDINEAQTEIELQFELDGQTVDKITLALASEGNIQVDAGWPKE